VIGTAVYLVGTVLAARWLAPRITDHMTFSRPADRADVAAGRALALLIGLLWPFVLIGVLVMWRTPESHEQIKRERDDAQKRIQELERELGIGGDHGQG